MLQILHQEAYPYEKNIPLMLRWVTKIYQFRVPSPPDHYQKYDFWGSYDRLIILIV